jgi:hypothetical protein
MPTPFGYVLRQSELLKRRVNEILDTLKEERVIVEESINGEKCLRRTPHLAAALAAAVQGGSISPPGPMAPVIAIRAPQPVPQVPLVPFSDTLDDDEGWSSFDG